MQNALYKSEYGDIYYELSGPEDAPIIIFTHGVGMDHRTFEKQIEAIKDNYRVIVWDLPGHGRSTLKEHKQRFTRMSSDCLYGLMNEVGVNTAVLVGQSLGSMIVQHFLIKYPSKVSATVHVPGIELKSHIGSWAKIFFSFIMGMLHLIPKKTFYRAFGRHRAVKPEVQIYLSQTMEKTGKKLALRITKDMVYDLIDGMPAIDKRPLLITYGEKDLFFIRKGSVKWHQKISDSKCVKILSANHIANQDNPEEFNKTLIDFLDANKTTV